MKVLIVNTYHYIRGGDSQHAISLGNLLECFGHQVHYFGMISNRNIPCGDEDFFVSEIDYRKAFSDKKIFNAYHVISKSIYSLEARQKMFLLLNDIKPDIAHIHSIRHHLTKSILPVLYENKIPIIWTLHDFKELCPNTTLYDGKTICESCAYSNNIFVLYKRCKKKSFIASLITYLEAVVNSRKLYNEYIFKYISPSKFLRNKFIEHGYSSHSIEHIPNFLDVNNITPYYDYDNYFLYVGRLEKEKGLETLIRAFNMFNNDMQIHLMITGEGSYSHYLKELVNSLNIHNIQFTGFLKDQELKSTIQNAKAVIIPSEWYENYPFVILEAMAYGKPVVGSRIGGIVEQVDDGETGYLFTPNDVYDLFQKLFVVNNLSKEKIFEMGFRARRKVEDVNAPSKYMNKITSVYCDAINAIA